MKSKNNNITMKEFRQSLTREKMREYHKEYEEEARKKGLCIRCRQCKAHKERAHCSKCLRYLRTKQSQYAKLKWKTDKEFRRLNNERRKKDLLVEKINCFIAYGGVKCACCGEKTLDFLTLDHINNDGAEERRKQKGRGGRPYSFVRKRGYPTGYQVLCWNCNCGRAQNGGICPHEITRRRVKKK